MTSGERGRLDRRTELIVAEVSTDMHTARCGDCAAGVCGRADDLYEAEFHAFERWSDERPWAASAYLNATLPTEI